MSQDKITFRSDIRQSDIKVVEEIVRSTGFFRDDEVEVAVDLVKERIEQGKSCGYEFLFGELDGKPVSYACYGLIPCSLISYDLYWIVTHNDFRGKGIGKKLMAETEARISGDGGKAVYVETSSKELYKPTCSFYLSNNYILKARFEDFYEPGDDKLVYVKNV